MINHQNIAIPRMIESRYQSLKDFPDTLIQHGFFNILFLVGEGIPELFKNELHLFLSDKRLKIHGPIVFEDLTAENLVKKAYELPTADVVVTMGGGKAVDCGKYAGFLKGIPVITVPTSISNDGFSSSGVSLLVNGKRKSLPAKMPYGIIADLSILSTAPERFYFSGLGDVISKITASFDWQFEVSQGVGQIDHFAMLLAKKSVNSVVRLPFEYIHEGLFIKEVVDSLIMSGISMEVAGNSSPASGSEHLISHAMDILAPGKYLHGIQVGLATYLMSLVQDYRAPRIKTFLTDTGFFNYVKELKIPASLLMDAIDLAPGIKPQRMTTIHTSGSRTEAKELLHKDPVLSELLFFSIS